MKVPFVDLAPAHGEVRAALDAAYRRVLDRSTYVLGTEVETFEEAFARWCGVRHCIGVGNGLDALTLILRGLGIGAGDEVIVPAHTFIATWLAVTQVGARPHPVEPDPRTLNIDPQRVVDSITPRTRAILAVHLYGRLADMAALRDIADRHGLRLVEDAAQAHGARRGGRAAGAWGDAAAFSFYPTKNLGALGDGGAVTTDDQDLAARIRALRNYGSTRKYVHDVAGVNSRLDALQAAFLAEKLPHVERWNGVRRRIAERYREALDGDDRLIVPPADDPGAHVWHLFVVRLRGRDRVAAALAEAGIATGIHYPEPPHRSAAYAGAAWPPLPLTERIADEVLSLPLYPGMAETQISQVIQALVAARNR